VVTGTVVLLLDADDEMLKLEEGTVPVEKLDGYDVGKLLDGTVEETELLVKGTDDET